MKVRLIGLTAIAAAFFLVTTDLAAAEPLTAAQKEQFRMALDAVFGAGHWRETSGYRTAGQENALRRQGDRL